MNIFKMTNLIKTVLIDLSGTLHIENLEIPEAAAALERNASLNIKFVTNTTKESRNFLYNRLISMGFNLKPEEIFTSLHAARDLVVQNKWRAMLLLEPAALEDFESVPQVSGSECPDAVVIGLAPSQFHYDCLNTAFRHVLNGAKLIAIHEARYYKTTTGLSLGPGPFVKALEYATGCTATVVGKPSQNFFKAALGNLPAETAVMIGDDVRDDILGAQASKMLGILVKSGKYRPGDELVKGTDGKPPYAVCDHFPAAVDYILNNL